MDVKAKKEKPVALAEKEQIIIGNKNQSNAGDDAANSFVIYREMGTQADAMNKESIFTQDLKKGTYQTEVAFIAREVL